MKTLSRIAICIASSALISGCQPPSAGPPPVVVVQIAVRRSSEAVEINRTVDELPGLTGETISGALLPGTYDGGRYTFYDHGKYIGDLTYGLTKEDEFLLYWNAKGQFRVLVVDADRMATNSMVLERYGSKVLKLGGASDVNAG